MTLQTSDDKPIPKRVQMLYNNWVRLYRIWWATHYATGIFGGAAGGIAGIFASKPESSGIGMFFGLVAAVSTSLVTFLGPLQKAERYYQAFHLLDQTLLEYERGKKTDDELLVAVKASRDIVLGTTVTGHHETPQANPPA